MDVVARRRRKINILPGNNRRFPAHFNPEPFPSRTPNDRFRSFFSFVFCRQYAIVTPLRYETGR